MTHPFPGAFTERDGNKLYIWKSLPEDGCGEAGAVVSAKPLVYGTGKGLLRVLRVQPEGETERDA